jgi:Putative bacterial sensory transduction regulator
VTPHSGGTRGVVPPGQHSGGTRGVVPPGQQPPGALLGAVLEELGVEYESVEPGSYLVTLRGEHKLQTKTWLIAGTHSLLVEAFFCRQPDENHAAFYRFLLQHNARMYGVHFALDPVGDVYLVGRQPLAAISAAEIDRLLGCVLSYADDTFDQALMIGFAEAIRKEYAWRVKRGESLANLRAFARLTGPSSGAGGVGQPRFRDA